MPLLSIRRRPRIPELPPPLADASFLPRTVLDRIAPTDIEQRRDALVVENLPAAGLAVTECRAPSCPAGCRASASRVCPSTSL
jgi:hypothetical protein